MIKIFSDSACDFSADLIEKWDIGVIPFYVMFDGVHSYKDRVDLQPKEFYAKLQEEKTFPKTSQPSIQDYIDHFRPCLDAGQDIICVCISTKLSGSYQSAFNAKNILRDEYPDRKIQVIDSLSVTGCQGLLLYQIIRMKEDGKSFEFILDKIPTLVASSKLYFMVETLDYLQKGGRIGKAGALAGSLLNIKPIISVENGELVPAGKMRGRKKAYREIINLVAQETADDIGSYHFVTVNADCESDALEVEQILQEEYKIKVILHTLQIGLTIGSHIGAKCIGLSYIKKYENC